MPKGEAEAITAIWAKSRTDSELADDLTAIVRGDSGYNATERAGLMKEAAHRLRLAAKQGAE